MAPRVTAEIIGAIYEAAELRILDRIAVRLLRGVGAPDWAIQKILELDLVRRDVNRELDRATSEAIRSLAEILQASYDAGTADALGELVRGAIPRPTTAFGGPPNSLRALLAETTKTVLTVNARVLRSTEDVYRTIVRDTASGMILGTETREQAVQSALNQFADRGVTGFVDRRGRSWEMSAYTEMAVGTATHRASTNGHVDQLAASGRDLVVVSDHSGECPACRPFEGKVLSISGESEEYPSIASARAAGLEHPGCRHRYGIWIPGISTKPEPQGKPEDYELRSKQRAMERQIRAWKRREAVGDPTAAAKVKAHQKALREYVAENGLKRQSRREQLRTGATGVARPTKT